MVLVMKVHSGRKGRQPKRPPKASAGRKTLWPLPGGSAEDNLSEKDLRGLVARSLERCRRCRATEPLDEACIFVSSCAHLLGLDWEQGVPVCSCRRLPRAEKSWHDLVKHARKNVKSASDSDE